MQRNILSVLVLASCLVFFQSTSAQNGSAEPQCPSHPHQRTDAEVLQDHVAAFESGNAALVACDYAKNALFILPDTATQGQQNIEAVFAQFLGFAGGNIQVTTKSLTIADGFGLFEYSISSDHVTVTDGVDTFVIDHGLIEVHTAHLGGLSFH